MTTHITDTELRDIHQHIDCSMDTLTEFAAAMPPSPCRIKLKQSAIIIRKIVHDLETLFGVIPTEKYFDTWENQWEDPREQYIGSGNWDTKEWAKKLLFIHKNLNQNALQIKNFVLAREKTLTSYNRLKLWEIWKSIILVSKSIEVYVSSDRHEHEKLRKEWNFET